MSGNRKHAAAQLTRLTAEYFGGVAGWTAPLIFETCAGKTTEGRSGCRCDVAHRELFKADPVRYAPQFSSYCAISLTRGEVVEGNPEYWLISGGKLYLFGKPTGPAVFQQALTENID